MFTPPDAATYFATVWEIVRQIPPRKVSTYGQIASMIPLPAGADPLSYGRVRARWVGSAMRAVPSEPPVPWQRVINSKGEISLRAGGGAEKQRAMLEAEGVVFNARDRVDFKQFGWAGPDADWLAARGLLAPKPLP